jgi:uncharacterized membrane protein
LNKIGKWLSANFKKEFFAGLLFLVPLVAAGLIILWLFNILDGILQPVIKLIFGRSIVGLGIVSSILLILIVGIIWHNIIGRAILKSVERGFARIPIFSQVYTGAKQVMESVGGAGNAAFKETVLVDFPIKGTKAIAFITNEMVDENGEKVYVVYMPGSPNPTSGFLQLLREPHISRPDLPVDSAMRMIVSCGMVSPEKCQGFGLADGYRTGQPVIHKTEDAVPAAVPITLSEIETLKGMKLRGPSDPEPTKP